MKPFSGQAKDQCPSWACSLIEQLLSLEMQLGNIPPAADWSEEMVENLQKRLSEAPAVSEESTQVLFQQISQSLKKAGFGSKDIAGFINARIGYVGGPPYCSAAEVDEA